MRIIPRQARWVKIVITSNWGNPTWTELGQLSAYDDGSRPGDMAGQLKQSGATEIYGIYFDFAAATLRPESRQTLEEIATLLRNDAALQFIVEGHTDDRGDAAANLALSEARAQAVCRALADMGIAASRLEAVGYGESRPISSNDHTIGRAQNRRVTLRVKQAGGVPGVGPRLARARGAVRDGGKCGSPPGNERQVLCTIDRAKIHFQYQRRYQ